MYKTQGAEAIPVSSMDGRAIVESGVLTLRGLITLWALNNPAWAAVEQLTTPLSISVDVKLGSTAAYAGLALRVSNTEPASYYLLQLVNGVSGHAFYKVTAGVKVLLGSATSGVCGVSTSAFRRIVFTHAGTSLTATCDGVSLGSVTDSSNRFLAGTAGLYHENGGRTYGTSSIFDNLLIERGCDGPKGGCPAALPGEQCFMSCAAGSTAAQASSQNLTCGNSGAWSSSPLLCIPLFNITEFTFEVLENAAPSALVGRVNASDRDARAPIWDTLSY
ncbi:cadherin repeat domain-containing protein, partial [archaeon]